MEENTEVPVEETAEVVEQAEPAEKEVTEQVEPAEEGTVIAFEPKKKTAQERIDEITKARREAEREREYWKRVALEKEPKEQLVAHEIPGVPSRPTIDQFDTTSEYEDALLVWHDTRKEAKTRAERQRLAEDESLKTFQSRAKKLREEHADFDEVIEAPVFSQVMRSALLHSENGPAVAYFLGRPENIETAEKIRALPTELQPYELGKLETKLMLAQQTKKVPGAPPPLKPVGITGGGEIDPSKMSDDEWYAWEKQQTMKRLESRYNKGG